MARFLGRDIVAAPKALTQRPRPAAFAVAAILLLLLSPQASAQVQRGLGAGVFSVRGAATDSIVLPVGGTYYLTLAADSASSPVAAQLFFNGTLVAEANATVRSSTVVSLPAGTYSLSLSGQGRAALGWDFANGRQQTFPGNETLVAFLVPSGPRLGIAVAMGDAQEIHLLVYDDELNPAANATVTKDGTVTVDLPSGHASIAYLVATVVAGRPNGLFGLSYTAEALPTPFGFGTWQSLALWIAVPVLVTLAAYLILRRRRRPRRPPTRPSA